MDNKITLKDTGEMVPAKDMYEIITNLENELEQKENELKKMTLPYKIFTLLESTNNISYVDIIQHTDNLEIVQYILGHISQDFLKIAFIKQCEQGNTEIVKFLLEHGADVHAKNDEALTYAAENGHTEIVKMLIENGAHVFADNNYAVRYAAKKGHTEIVKLLLEHGADIHADNDCALCWAAFYGRTETVRLLLEYGAKVHAKNNEALRNAAQRGHTEITELLTQKLKNLNLL